MDPVPPSITAATIASAIALSVANINDPSAELGAITGTTKGAMRLCYQTVAGADEWTLYVWDSASSTTASTPYRINGSSGQWIAIGGKYGNGDGYQTGYHYFVDGAFIVGSVGGSSGGAYCALQGALGDQRLFNFISLTGGTGAGDRFSCGFFTDEDAFSFDAYGTNSLLIDHPIYVRRAAGLAIDFRRPVALTDTTEASAVGTASEILAGGLGVAKRSYLGTIGSTFKGNVLAGVQDGTAASAGQVGEVLSSVVSAVTVTGSGTAGNVTSLSVTAGAWNIFAFGVIAGGATGLTSGSTAKLSVVTGSATNGTSGASMAQQSVLALLANDLFSLSVQRAPVQITGTTTFYLTEEVTFAAGSPSVDATLAAVRIR